MSIKRIKIKGVTYDIEDAGAQRVLVSGTNIKTINGTSIVGSGNVQIAGSAPTVTNTTLSFGGSTPGPDPTPTDVITFVVNSTTYAAGATANLGEIQGDWGTGTYIGIITKVNDVTTNGGTLTLNQVTGLYDVTLSGRTIYIPYEGQNYNVPFTMTVKFSYNGLSASLTLIGNYQCFMEGSKVLMADGSLRNIEDVRGGDEVKYYSPSKQSLQTTRVLIDPIFSECPLNFETVSKFSDGSEIHTYGRQVIWNVTQGKFVPILEWAIGEEGLNKDGERVQLISRGDYPFDGKKYHYFLITKAGAYIVDNIATGHIRGEQYKLLMACGTPEQINYFSAAELDWMRAERDWMQFRLHYLKSESYLNEVAPFEQERKTLQETIDEGRKYLDSTDYLALKYVDGALTEEEYAGPRVERDRVRHEVNDALEVLEACDNTINGIKDKYKELARTSKLIDFRDPKYIK